MGDTDTAMLWGIIGVFVFLGAVLPFIHAAFDQPVTQLNSEGVQFASGQDLEESSEVGILDVIFSIFTIFFWTFGSIPALLDIIVFVPMRIIFLVLLYRNLRGN